MQALEEVVHNSLLGNISQLVDAVLKLGHNCTLASEMNNCLPRLGYAAVVAPTPLHLTVLWLAHNFLSHWHLCFLPLHSDYHFSNHQ